MILDSYALCFYFLKAGLTGMHHHGPQGLVYSKEGLYGAAVPARSLILKVYKQFVNEEKIS